MKYDFSHYLMICKTYRMPTPPGGAKPAATMIYTNEEEELFAEVMYGSLNKMADIVQTFSVAFS